MPQLESSMFVDQIAFMSLIFFLSHIYNNEVVLPSISIAKQYRRMKLNFLSKSVRSVATYNVYTGFRERHSMLKRFKEINNETFKAEVSTVFFYSRCIAKPTTRFDIFLAEESLKDVEVRYD